MFTSKAENSCGIYMIRNTKTDAAYVGASTNIANRLNGHRGTIRRGKASPGDKHAPKFIAAFPNIDDVEFRVLEFITATYVTDPDIDDETLFISPVTVDLLDQRERHWIAELKPSLNRHKVVTQEPVESLPYGAEGLAHGEPVQQSAEIAKAG